jgi:molecular chaperone DnaK
MAELVIGIDLGTTNSAVATVEGGRPRVIPSRTGGRLTPSLVGFTPRGERLVGEAAAELADAHPERVGTATKRFLGRRFTPELAQEARATAAYQLVAGPLGDTRIKLGGQVMPLTQVSAMVLTELKKDADAFFGRPVRHAVITVPANFDDGQRQATKEAAHIAGLNVLRLVNEPTAAAVAYGLSKGFQGRALVFDLGGGTFDVSILHVQDGVFEVVATGGDPQLGGEDFDTRIVEWLLAQLPDDVRPRVLKDVVSMRRLRVAAEQAKRSLGQAEEAEISIGELGDHREGGPFVELTTALTRPFFESLCSPLIERCLKACEGVLAQAGATPEALDAVLMVGGMTRVPVLRQRVQAHFGKAPAGGLNPDEVVALGAAVHADELARQSGAALLIDVTSHSLGVQVQGGRVRRLIERDSNIPCVARQTFLPSRTGQSEARIRIVQGEGDYAKDCRALGEVVLRELPQAERGDVPLEVHFELAADGTLSVKATSVRTGALETLVVEARGNLPEAELERLREEEAVHAQEGGAAQDDENFRRLVARALRFLKVLRKSAREEAAGDGVRQALEAAEVLVAEARAMVEAGRAPDAEKRADLSRRLALLVAGR